jgi:hypothetical protein
MVTEHLDSITGNNQILLNNYRLLTKMFCTTEINTQATPVLIFSSHLIVGFIPNVAPLHLAENRDEARDQRLNHGCLSLVQQWLQGFVDNISMSIPAQLCSCLQTASNSVVRCKNLNSVHIQWCLRGED